MGIAKQPKPQWDETNKVWRWWDPTRKKHVRLGKASSKSNREGRTKANELLNRYLLERDNEPVTPGGPTTGKNGLDDHAERWVSKQRRRACKGLHSHEYARKSEVALDRLVKILGDGNLERLSQSKTIDSYLKSMEESDLAPKTISNYYGTFGDSSKTSTRRRI